VTERLDPEPDYEAHLIDRAVQKERNDIIDCIRSTTWSGSEEIVEMIKRRSAFPATESKDD
jgi:hypothetical protein